MPFGLRNAPATISRLVIKMLIGLEAFTGSFLDDVIICSQTWDEHLQHLERVLVRVKEAGLTLHLKKMRIRQCGNGLSRLSHWTR